MEAPSAGLLNENEFMNSIIDLIEDGNSKPLLNPAHSSEKMYTSSAPPSPHWKPIQTPFRNPTPAVLQSTLSSLALFSPQVAPLSEMMVPEMEDDNLLLTPLISPALNPGLNHSIPPSHSADEFPVPEQSGSKPLNMVWYPHMLASPTLCPDPKLSFAPLTPASLMHLDKQVQLTNTTNSKQERQLDDIKPALPPQTAMKMEKLLAEKSNYEILKSGDSAQLGLNYQSNLNTSSSMDIRRSNHKLAEQRRRDCIKKCFEDLKKVLPNITEKHPSKLHLLQKSFEYILYLQEREKTLSQQIEKQKSK